MITIRSAFYDPAFNLATEEFILSSELFKEDVLYFYVNDSSVIIGRNQITWDEIDVDYVKANHIHVVRRLSGGGAVYHDRGNLNYSFVMHGTNLLKPDFSRFTAPIIKAINQLGAPVELNGRNDITLKDVKISGNAYYHNAYGAVCHGTLLYDVDMDILEMALRGKNSKTQTRAVRSAHSRVDNLKRALPSSIENVDDLRLALIRQISANSEEITESSIPDKVLPSIQALVDHRYGLDQWNYGEPVRYDIKRENKFDCGKISVYLTIQDGVIKNSEIHGDFFSDGDVTEISKALIGVLFEKEAIEQAISEGLISKIFPTISKESFVSFLFP